MLVSLIIPVAKSQFLVKAIESVIRQTYQNWEIVIIDDIVDPAVEQKVSGFLGSGRIKYWKPSANLGHKFPTKTWNYGLQFATGDYAVLLGDDDFLSENYLEKMTELAVKHPKSNLFRARLAIVDQNDQIFEYGMGLPEFEQWDELMYFRNMYGRRQSTSEMMFKLDFLKRIGGFVQFPFAWSSDDATWLTLSADSGLYSTNEAYAYFRRHPEALSNNMDLNKVELIEKDFINWSLQFVEQNYSASKLTISKELLISSLGNRLKRLNDFKEVNLIQLIKNELKTRIKGIITDLRIYDFNK